MNIKLTALFLSFLLLVSFASCSSTAVSDKDLHINVGILKGPTGMGTVYMLENANMAAEGYNASFTVAASPSELTGGLISGELDIAALPTNVAATLYNKTDGDIQLMAINTLGVLYILSNNDIQLNTLADLKGQTVYATGQGANPEYVLSYLLSENGVDPSKDVNIEFGDSDEISIKMAAGEIDICMLPVPNVTSVLAKNKNIRVCFDLTEEWNKVSVNGSALTMGCVSVRREFADSHPDELAAFMLDYGKSIVKVNTAPFESSALIEKHGITGSAAIAEAAIPQSNIVWITGDSMRDALDGFFKILYNADSSSIGGIIPDDDFYYKNTIYEKNKA